MEDLDNPERTAEYGQKRSAGLTCHDCSRATSSYYMYDPIRTHTGIVICM